MVNLLHFIHLSLDKSTPHAVALAAMDLSKAYNQTSHQLVIEDLAAMGVPGWLLAIIVSYLNKRTMIVRHKGASSSPRTLYCGASQGCYLGNLIFIVKFNGVLLRPPVTRPLTHNKAMQVKFVDDQTIAASINLKKPLLADQCTRPRPLRFHERTEHIIKPEENLLQAEITRLVDFTCENKFLINEPIFHLIFSCM